MLSKNILKNDVCVQELNEKTKQNYEEKKYKQVTIYVYSHDIIHQSTPKKK